MYIDTDNHHTRFLLSMPLMTDAPWWPKWESCCSSCYMYLYRPQQGTVHCSSLACGSVMYH